MTYIFLFLFICIGGIVLFYYLRNNLILFAYFFIVFFAPYASQLGGKNLKISYLIVPIICYLTVIVILKILDYFIIYDSIIYLTILYTILVYISLILNRSLISKSSLSIVVLWTLGVLVFLIFTSYLSKFSVKELYILGINLLWAFCWIGLISVGIGLLELRDPDVIHPLYCPIADEQLHMVREIEGGGIDFKYDRIRSIIGSPNTYGSFSTMVAVFILAQGLLKKNITFMGLAVIFAIIAFFLSGSRGALIAFAGVIFFALILYKKYFYIVLMILFTLFLLAINYEAVIAIFQSKGIKITEITGISSLDERLFFWITLLISLLHNPIHILYGFGPSNELMHSLINVGGGHNIFINAIHSYGIFALIILIMLIFRILKNNFSCIKNNPQYINFFIPFLFITTFLCLHSLVDNIFYVNSAIMWIYFPVLAIFINLHTKLKGN